MAFDWKDFLAVARTLQNFSGTPPLAEAMKRTAVSRAYYSAFCFLRNHAEAHLGFRRKATGQDHKSLRDYLREQGSPWDEIADRLEALQKWRGQCDYDDMVSDLDSMVSNAIVFADKIIQQCK